MKKEDIYKLAELSQLTITESEVEAYQKDFEGILAYIDAIKSISLPETFTQSQIVKNVLRDDSEMNETGIFSGDILTAAPHREGDYFKVKKIL